MENFQSFLEKYASELTAKYSLPITFNPEDQLKSPVANLIKHFGDLQKRKIETITEIQVVDLGGRPDISIAVKFSHCRLY